MLGVLKPGEESGLAQSVDLYKFRLRQEFTGPPDQLRGDGRPTIREHFKAGQILRMVLSELDEKVDHRRDQNRVIHALLRYDLTESFGLKARESDLARAESRRRENGGE